MSNTVTRFGQTSTKYELQSPREKRQEVRGLNFPLGIKKESGGFFKSNSGRPMIKQAIEQLLRTEKGERIMLPNFGCTLRKYLFQPITEDLFADIKQNIVRSFNDYIEGATLRKIGIFETGEYDAAGGNQLRVILSVSLDSDSLEVFDVEARIR